MVRRALLIRAVALASGFVLAGCATAPTFIDTTAPGEPTKVDKVYIYSFVDLRSTDLGSEFMVEIEKQLGEGFRALGVEPQQHWFRRDPIFLEMAVTLATGYSSARIPVREVIARNAPSEQAFGAKYRLVVFIPFQHHDIFFTALL